MAADTLKAQAQSRDLKVGHFIVEFATPGIGHMLKNAGCDFVLFDTEHSGFHHETIKSVLRYFEAARLPAIVRVPSKEYHHIARAADMGAEGIMLPMVNDADEARHVLNCMKYTPDGAARRGAGRGARPATGAVPSWTSSPPPTRAPPSSPRSRPAPAWSTPTRSRHSTASTASGSAISTCRRPWASPASSSTRTSSTRSTPWCGPAASTARPPDGWCRTSPPARTTTPRASTTSAIRATSGPIRRPSRPGVDGIRAACGGGK